MLPPVGVTSSGPLPQLDATLGDPGWYLWPQVGIESGECCITTMRSSRTSTDKLTGFMGKPLLPISTRDRSVAPDNLIDPKRLTPLTRTSLKEAFRAVAKVQRGIGAKQGFTWR